MHARNYKIRYSADGPVGLGQDTRRGASHCCTSQTKRCSQAIIWLGRPASIGSAS